MRSEKMSELAKALTEVQKIIKPALKDSPNPFYKSKYADLTSVWDACREALSKNGFSVIQTVQTSPKGAYLSTMLLHISGEWVSGKCPLINQKGDMQGLGSSISYARRYGLASIVGVVSEDDDANSADQVDKKPLAVPTVPPLTNPGDYIPQVKKFKDKWPGKKLSEIPNADYEILNYITWLKREGTKFPEQKEFIHYGELYLKKHPSEPPDVEGFNPELNWGKK